MTATAGSWGYVAGTTGTASIPEGAAITHIRAESHSNTGALAIFGGDSVLLNGDSGAGQHMVFEMTFQEDGRPTSKSGASSVVFTNTASYFVGYVQR